MRFSSFLTLFLLLIALEKSSAIHCYSCTSDLTTASRSNLNCLRNLTAIRTIRCRKGYYCLSRYQIYDGVVGYVRRTCQNPNSDHDLGTEKAPTRDECVSQFSRSSARKTTTTCYFHCTTNRCNKIAPDSIKTCSKSCPTSCDPTTGQCSAAKRCVQCSSEIDPDCEQNSVPTPCPKSSYAYCAVTKTNLLKTNGNVVKTVVSKSCTSFTNSYRVPRSHCYFSGNNNYDRFSNQFMKYTCSKFCVEDGCNAKTPDLSIDGSRLSCVVCSQVGSIGYCSQKTETTPCQPDARYCKASLSYFIQNGNAKSSSSPQRIAYVKRECATAAVVTRCQTQPVNQSNLDYVTCQETCSTNGCNTGWPARPKCSQCVVTNRTYTLEQFQNCFSNPSPPKSCRSPAYTHCFWSSNNTASQAGFPRSIERGCSIGSKETSCTNIVTHHGTTLRHCQGSCSRSGCNRGRIP